MMKLFLFLSLYSIPQIAGQLFALAKPNIIFIMVDDMGYHDLGCYGSKTISTPNIDRMAKEGIRFTDCYSGDTVCASARSTLMTGYHKGHTPVRGIREESLFSRKISLWLKSSKKQVM